VSAQVEECQLSTSSFCQPPTVLIERDVDATERHEGVHHPRGLIADATGIRPVGNPTHAAAARRIIEAWRSDYNTARPHTSLNGLTPAAFATRPASGKWRTGSAHERGRLGGRVNGHGGVAMAAELREVERRRETLQAEIAAAGAPEPVPVLHPNLPALYRRKVEALEEALKNEATALLAAEALRSLIDAILVHPGERRGEVSLSLRGDLAAFLHVAEADREPTTTNSKTAVALGGNGRSVFGREVLGSLDAGTRIGLRRTVLTGLERPSVAMNARPSPPSGCAVPGADFRH
jgi:hypothetical protein